MKLTTKQVYDFKHLLERILDGGFLEDDIEKLMIFLRPISAKNSIIWELASFIAHQEKRTRGIFQERLDISYLAFKNLYPLKGKQEKINPLKIKKKVFDILILGGLKLFPKKTIKEKTGKSYEECVKLLKKHYSLSDGVYRPINLNSIKIILPIVSIPLSSFKIDDIFTEEQLKDDIFVTVIRLCKMNNILLEEELFKAQLNEILICIICILQQREFELFDGVCGTCEGVILDNRDTKDYNYTILGNLLLESFTLSMPFFTYTGCMSKHLDKIPSSPEEWGKFNKQIFKTERNKEGELKLKYYR